MRMRKISKKFREAMRNFANFRIMRFFAKCEFSQNANFRKMRFSRNAIFAKCEFSHAIFSQNANFECNFRMRIFKGDYRMQKLVTPWPKNFQKKNRKIYLQEFHYPPILTYIYIIFLSKFR